MRELFCNSLPLTSLEKAVGAEFNIFNRDKVNKQ